ncbi:MAG: hypothetical protein ABSC06_17965 [Rhodopila sp.]
MQQHIAMQHQKDRRRQREECPQRQIDTEKRQFDRLLEEQILMRHRTRGDQQIEQREEIGQPLALAASSTAFRSASRSFAFPATARSPLRDSAAPGSSTEPDVGAGPASSAILVGL